MNFLDEARKFIPESIDYAAGVKEISAYTLRGQNKPLTFDDVTNFLWLAIGWRDRVSEMEGDAKAHASFRDRLHSAAKERYTLKLHIRLRVDPIVKEQKNQKAQLAEAEKELQTEVQDMSDAADNLALAEAYHKKVLNKLKELQDLAQDLDKIGKNMERSRFLHSGYVRSAPSPA